MVQGEEEQSLTMEKGEQEAWWGVNTLPPCIGIMAVLIIAFGYDIIRALFLHFPYDSRCRKFVFSSRIGESKFAILMT